MYQNVLTPVTTFSIFKSGHQIATQLGYKMVHFRTLKNKKKRVNSVFTRFGTFWYCYLAESEGFEPPEPLGSTVFKTAAIDHSANSPGQK